MAESKVNLKLLIDKNAKKVLFAEAGKDAVDFLFNLLALPVSTVISLLSKQKMVGSLGNLYESVENLGEEYIQPNKNKDTLLKPKSPITDFPRLMIDIGTPTPSGKKAYRYSSCACNLFSATRGNLCRCGNAMYTEIAYDGGCGRTTVVQEEGGFVKGVVTYMVMDNLVVKPMSTISSITMLNQFNVKDVGALQEKIVHLDITKALKLLEESLHSNAVLTTVFLSTE